MEVDRVKRWWEPGNVSYTNRRAPVMDAYVGLLEPPEWVLYLGLRSKAAKVIRSEYPGVTVMSQRQFNREGLRSRYNDRVGVLHG